jgi:hypothetical protein
MILLDLSVVDVNKSNILGLSVHSLGNPEGEKVELGAAVVELIISAQMEPVTKLFRRLSWYLHL